jgi:hypothetical protein
LPPADAPSDGASSAPASVADAPLSNVSPD